MVDIPLRATAPRPEQAGGERALIEIRVRDRRRGRPDRRQLIVGRGRCRVSRHDLGQPDTTVSFEPVAFLRFVAGQESARGPVNRFASASFRLRSAGKRGFSKSTTLSGSPSAVAADPAAAAPISSARRSGPRPLSRIMISISAGSS